MAREPVELPSSPALSILRNQRAALKGRKVGLLFADRSARSDITIVKATAERAGGRVMSIAPRLKSIQTTDGMIDADQQLTGTPSCLVDAIVVILSPEGATALSRQCAAVQFVMDAFGHLMNGLRVRREIRADQGPDAASRGGTGLRRYPFWIQHRVVQMFPVIAPLPSLATTSHERQ
jgi:hypothetical protein